MTTLLALDTASDNCSVALWQAGQVLARCEFAPRRHGELLLPMIDAVLAEAQLPLAACDAIAFGRGPGSFTGLRIAAAVTQGLAFGADLPVLPVSDLAALAEGAHAEGEAPPAVAVLLDARLQEVYAGWYVWQGGRMQPVAADALLAPAALAMPATPAGADWVGVGPGWAAYPEALAHLQPAVRPGRADLLPEARHLLPQALADWSAGVRLPASAALPVYLRDAVAWRS